MLSVITSLKYFSSFVINNLVSWDCEYPTPHNLSPTSLASIDDSEMIIRWLQSDDFIILSFFYIYWQDTPFSASLLPFLTIDVDSQMHLKNPVSNTTASSL